jgi:putative Mg2+ transporter-C (MgtC) family protein
MALTEDIISKLFLALILGGLIGAEREYRSKSAGFRTIMMICLGATLFTIFSLIIGTKGTPDRIASNIVVGIGFVGAGVVFKADTGVSGITTAATIWVTAAIGMAIGAGYQLIAIIACMLVLTVLFLFTFLQGWIDRTNQFHEYKIICEYNNETLHRFEDKFHYHHLKYKRIKQIKSDNCITGIWVVQGSEKNHLGFIEYMVKDPTIKGFEF